jgi:hypothetical protein
MTFDRSRYPADWDQIRARVLARAEQRCECRGECSSEHDRGRCDAPNRVSIVRHDKMPELWRTSDDLIDAFHQHGNQEIRGYELNAPITVVLTIAHLDHDRESDEGRMRAVCQRCRLRLDRYQHTRNARETRRPRRAVGSLPGVE